MSNMSSSNGGNKRKTRSSGTDDAISSALNAVQKKKRYVLKPHRTSSVKVMKTGMLAEYTRTLNEMEYFKAPAQGPLKFWLLNYIRRDPVLWEIFSGLRDDGERVRWVMYQREKAEAMANGDIYAYENPPPPPPSNH